MAASLIDTIPRFQSPVPLRGMGSCYLGGRTARVESHPDAFIRNGEDTLQWEQQGHFSVGQLYAQVFLPLHARQNATLVFWHGGGLSGTQWEATPDGRAGWLQCALADGFDSIVCDAAERGRAGIPHPAFVGEAPVFRSNERAWSGFRIGPEGGYTPDPDKRVVYEGQRFPFREFDAFSKLFTARWSAFRDDVQAAYAELIGRAGEAIVLIAHSEGARYAQRCAAEFADRVTALVLIEPAGACLELSPDDRARLRDVPCLVVWGDYLDRNSRWQTLQGRYASFAKSVSFEAHTAISLNDLGMRGHSHFPMIDHGNTEVWRCVSDWISDTLGKHDSSQEKRGRNTP